MWKVFILLYFIIHDCSGYKRNFNRLYSRPRFVSNKETPSNMWKLVSKPLKEEARKWFIRRAIIKGIDWHNITNKYKGPQTFSEILKLKQELQNITMNYPEYFLQPFHGYDDGNMNWDAAQELEAASLSMSANYWKNVCVRDSVSWVRNNITNNIKYYINKYNPNLQLDYILDVGSSGGISTEYLCEGFPESKRVYGLDLSPYFVAVSAYRAQEANNMKVQYVHENAEKTSFEDESFELIVCNFFFHEVPYNATTRIINELYRILKYDGVLAIVDLDPDKVRNNLVLNEFRKWAFEVTEPHIYQYYQNNMSETLSMYNFDNVTKVENDPINGIWFGIKSNKTCDKNDVEHCEGDCGEDCCLDE